MLHLLQCMIKCAKHFFKFKKKNGINFNRSFSARETFTFLTQWDPKIQTTGVKLF